MNDLEIAACKGSHTERSPPPPGPEISSFSPQPIAPRGNGAQTPCGRKAPGLPPAARTARETAPHLRRAERRPGTEPGKRTGPRAGTGPAAPSRLSPTPRHREAGAGLPGAGPGRGGARGSGAAPGRSGAEGGPAAGGGSAVGP